MARRCATGMVGAVAMAYTLGAGCTPANAKPALPSPGDPRWGCYDAAPGHPTEVERHSFIEEIAAVAQASERDDGPPAAGVMAMAALESGYGWTRTALFARNLFGWKAGGSSGPNGRPTWTLACQPSSDPGNRYVVFSSKAESVSFVAGRLRTTARYGAVARRYHEDRRNGLGIDPAVERWVRGVAKAGYNPYPGYPTKVLAIARNWRHPGAPGNLGDSLMPYSSSAASGPEEK